MLIELRNQNLSIWRLMRQSSLGTVLWAMKRDRQVLLDFKRALESVETQDLFANALQPTCKAFGNCVVQVALHQLAADPASTPHVEPRDTRWSLFRVLPNGVLDSLCLSIATFPTFASCAKAALSQAIDQIRRAPEEEGSSGEEAIAELLREYLVLCGVGIGDALDKNGLDFVNVLAQIARLNAENPSPLYPFTKPSAVSD